jgi:hypothetical protein
MSARSLCADINDGITNTRHPGTNQIGVFLRAKVMLPPTIAVISFAVGCRRREEAKNTVPQPTLRWIKVDREPVLQVRMGRPGTWENRQTSGNRPNVGILHSSFILLNWS